jgi:hypothetical protein
MSRKIFAVLAFALGLAFAASAVRAESDQYSIRPLDLNRAADREMLIRTLDPNGTATRMS